MSAQYKQSVRRIVLATALLLSSRLFCPTLLAYAPAPAAAASLAGGSYQAGSFAASSVYQFNHDLHQRKDCEVVFVMEENESPPLL